MATKVDREARPSVGIPLERHNKSHRGTVKVAIVIGIIAVSFAILLSVFHDSIFSAISNSGSRNAVTPPQQQTPNTIKPYVNTNYGFTITPPKGWDIRGSGTADGTSPIVTFLGPVEHGFTTNIEVRDESMKGVSFQTYLREYHDDLADKSKVNNLRFMEQHPFESTMPDRPDGYYYHYVLTVNGSPIDTMQALIPFEGKVYILTASSSSQEAGKYDTLFHQTLNTFGFLPDRTLTNLD